MKEVKDLKSLDINIIDEDLSPLISTLTGWAVELVGKMPGLHVYNGTHQIAICTEGVLLSELESKVSDIIDRVSEEYGFSENSFNREVMRDEMYTYMTRKSHIVDLNDGKMFITCE